MQIDFFHTFCMQIDYLVSPIMSLKGRIGIKWVNISDIIITHAIRLQPFRPLNYLYVEFLEKKVLLFLNVKRKFSLMCLEKSVWTKNTIIFEVL